MDKLVEVRGGKMILMNKMDLVGKITLDEIDSEILNYTRKYYLDNLWNKKPRRLIIDIQKENGGYCVRVYRSKH